MAQKKKPIGILWQVALIFVGSFLLTALLSYFAQDAVSSQTVNLQTETTAQRVADEVDQTIKEVPSYAWLIQYWHDHAQQMEVEYDKDYGPGTQTEEKVRLFSQRHPEMQIRYATQEEVAALSPEDQKLFAEINYSWMVQRINQIKQSVHPDFLFIVLTQKPYDSQFFLLSGAEQGASRGTGSDDVYPLGYIVTNISESQRTAMENAIHDTRYLADAGDYMDYYASLGKVGSYDLMVGVTYNVKLLKDNVTKQTWSAAGLIILYQIGILNLCLALLYFFILRPLKIIQENIRAYEETKDSDAVARNMAQIKTGNEMEVLAKDVTGLSKEIDEYIKNIENITAEKERIGTELALASRIQFSTLPNVFPPFPERSEFDLFATMNPAKEVGGDFYDFFMVDETHLAILIADVSGKSIPAALFMMVSMILIHNTADNLYSPAEVLTRVNNQLCAHNPEDMFVSVWLGIVDITDGTMVAANAGHEYPLVKSGDQNFKLFRDAHGFVLGGMEGLTFKEYTIQMQPGSKILIYTDGIPEATNAEKEMFGFDRMLASVNAHKEANPRELLEQLEKDVQQFVGQAEQFDDLTMLCLEYHGKPKRETDHE